MSRSEELQINKKLIHKGKGFGSQDDREYWSKQDPLDRLAALEYLRQVFYDYDPLTDRVQRIFSIARQPWS